MTQLQPPPTRATDDDVNPNEGWTDARSEAERAYDLILRALLSGEMAPTEDDPRSEITVAEELGFRSRMPVRMALSLLASEGLIVQRARYGFWRVSRDPDEILQICSMRARVEAMVASALSAGLYDHVVDSTNYHYGVALQMHAEMERLASDRKTANPSQPLEINTAFADADTRFHTALASATGYRLPGRNLSQWRNLLRLYRACNHLYYEVGDLRAINDEHQAILARAEEASRNCDDESDARLEAVALWHVAHSAVRAGVTLEAAALRDMVGAVPDPYGAIVVAPALPAVRAGQPA